MLTTGKLTEIWDKSHQNIPANKDISRYVADISSGIPSHSRVCDLGGGTGEDALYLAEMGHTVTIYDISPVALERSCVKAEERGVKISTIQSDFGSSEFSLPEDSFDFLYSRLSLHYFPMKQMVDILANVYRTLKPGGAAKITVKSPSDAKEMDFLRSTASEIAPGVFEEKGQIKARFTQEQLREIIRNAGLPEESYSVTEIVEDLGGRLDVTKSGNTIMILNEITISK